MGRIENWGGRKQWEEIKKTSRRNLARESDDYLASLVTFLPSNIIRRKPRAQRYSRNQSDQLAPASEANLKLGASPTTKTLVGERMEQQYKDYTKRMRRGRPVTSEIETFVRNYERRKSA